MGSHIGGFQFRAIRVQTRGNVLRHLNKVAGDDLC